MSYILKVRLDLTLSLLCVYVCVRVHVHAFCRATVCRAPLSGHSCFLRLLRNICPIGPPILTPRPSSPSLMLSVRQVNALSSIEMWF